MKPVFLDVEYTGEHAQTTLVSFALVALDGTSLYLTLNDYAQDQVSDWLRANVIAGIEPSKSVPSRSAFAAAEAWLEALADGGRIALVSAGLMLDVILLFELWRFAPRDRPFHYLHCLPPYLNHAGHLDLNTLFAVAGLGVGIDREAFAGGGLPGRRHDALHDALVIRQCFLRLAREYLPSIAHLVQT